MNNWKLIHQAAKNHSTPYPSLLWYVHKYKESTNARLKPNYNNYKAFSAEKEKELENYLLIF